MRRAHVASAIYVLKKELMAIIMCPTTTRRPTATAYACGATSGRKSSSLSTPVGYGLTELVCIYISQAHYAVGYAESYYHTNLYSTEVSEFHYWGF